MALGRGKNRDYIILYHRFPLGFPTKGGPDKDFRALIDPCVLPGDDLLTKNYPL